MPDFPRLAALAVTIHEDHVLLVRRRNPPDAGLWGYPGGHVEPGETALQAAVRELLEETGIIAAPRTYVGNVDVIRRDESGDLKHHFLLAAVLCDYLSGVPEAADDALEAEWFSLEQVLDGTLSLSDHVTETLQKAVGMIREKSG